ncbi:MAG: hypothetical protein K0U98_21620 [Deltaproteobacteria bacterium]|nr:hypothetical protein [Deltaproteobacteria bacterium]
MDPDLVYPVLSDQDIRSQAIGGVRAFGPAGVPNLSVWNEQAAPKVGDLSAIGC